MIYFIKLWWYLYKMDKGLENVKVMQYHVMCCTNLAAGSSMYRTPNSAIGASHCIARLVRTPRSSMLLRWWHALHSNTTSWHECSFITSDEIESTNLVFKAQRCSALMVVCIANILQKKQSYIILHFTYISETKLPGKYFLYSLGTTFFRI